MDVEFEDLVYKIEPKFWNSNDPGRCILKSVSGCFQAGHLSAILGPSGAGKSTLLNSISGYTTKGVSVKSFKVNGQPRDEKRFRKLSCYITQEEILQPMLSLNEVMMFAADLKLPAGTTRKQKIQLVHEIQAMLGLKVCCVTRTELLSGGQKKRLSIALELINNPPIIFLDEPTSGLDNVSTKNTLELLQKLAHQGRTVVCTIHQPSASLFQLFDHVYILSQGLCVYQGCTEELVPFLDSVGLPCPTHYNPADFAIEMTDSDHEANIKKLSKATDNGKLCRLRTSPDKARIVRTDSNGYVTSNNDNNNSSFLMNNNNILDNKVSFHLEYEHVPCLQLDPLNSFRDQDNNLSTLKFRSAKDEKQSSTILCVDFPTSCWSQFCTLWRRMTLQIFRNKIGLQIQFFHHLGCALALGLIFFGKAEDGTHFFDHLKFCLAIVLFHTFTYCMIPVITYPPEMKLLKREHFNRWYSLRPYYVAVQMARLPTMVFFNFIFITTVYFLSGLPREANRFVAFYTLGNLISITAEGMGFLIGSMFNITNGSAVAPLTIAPFLGLAIYGFDFARNIPWYIAFLMRLSFLRSGVVGVVITVFGMGRKPLNCLTGMFCFFKDPKTLMQYLALEDSSVWTQVVNMAGILFAFRIGMYIALKLKLSY